MKRKVLIITYYWPPSGGPGVQRVLKFAKYLPLMGWEPIILTVKDGEYPATDHSLTSDINPELKVFKIDSLEFFDLFRKITGKKKGEKIDTYELVKGKDQLSWKERLAQFIRINLLIPDARIGWYLRGYTKSLQIVKDTKPDIIFSSSPPHSLQLLARKLARKSGIKWVADFRDPWTKSFYDKGMNRWSLPEKINARFEEKVIASANCITSVSRGVLELLGAAKAIKTKVISNGFDATDFKFQKEKNQRFRIVYTGHIASVQNPVLFFQALDRLTRHSNLTLEVDFYGSVDRDIEKTVIEFGLQKIVTFHSYVTHDKITEIMIQADILLLLIPKQHAKGILTGKLFEYLAADNFILGIGEKSGDAAAVIDQCMAGIMVDYDTDPSSIIAHQWKQWNNGIEHRGNQPEIEKYSRQSLTRELAILFDELCD